MFRIKKKITPEARALEHIVECTLETIENMAVKSRVPVIEFKRHIEIARSGYVHLDNSQKGSGRIGKVEKYHLGDIESWAATLVAYNKRTDA